MVECYNCGSSKHFTGYCSFPQKLAKCTVCLAVSLTGRDHEPPCKPAENLIGLKMAAMAMKPLPILKVMLASSLDSFHVFNGASNEFEHIDQGAYSQFQSVETDGLFLVKGPEKSIEYSAISLKCFSILFAVFRGNDWYFRFRAFVTPGNGVVCVPIHKVFEKRGGRLSFPPEFSLNTAFIIGVSSANLGANIKMFVYANENGQILSDEDGYSGSVKWEKKGNSVRISESLNVNNMRELFFNSLLYGGHSGENKIETAFNDAATASVFSQVEKLSVEQVNETDVTDPFERFFKIKLPCNFKRVRIQYSVVLQ